jgi:hypothetical protein
LSNQAERVGLIRIKYNQATDTNNIWKVNYQLKFFFKYSVKYYKNVR